VLGHVADVAQDRVRFAPGDCLDGLPYGEVALLLVERGADVVCEEVARHAVVKREVREGVRQRLGLQLPSSRRRCLDGAPRGLGRIPCLLPVVFRCHRPERTIGAMGEYDPELVRLVEAAKAARELLEELDLDDPAQVLVCLNLVEALGPYE
jgi:hypothetical protein